MIREFEGKTELDAIDKALTELGLKRDDVEVEILESKKPMFLFGQGKVRIRVQYKDGNSVESIEVSKEKPLDATSFEEKIVTYLDTVISMIGITGESKVIIREENRFIVDIKSKYSSIIIGKKGKTLDALQLIINVYAGRIAQEKTPKIIIDTEDYRIRREKKLVSFAHKVADQVRKTRNSVLLDAMNPFERRLIHTTLNNNKDVETVSEGEGLYKKIRVIYRGR